MPHRAAKAHQLKARTCTIKSYKHFTTEDTEVTEVFCFIACGAINNQNVFTL